MKAPLKLASLLFLVDDHRILLAMKKRGFGAGLWNGVGGKPEDEESIDQTAIRECQEEIGVTPLSTKQVAVLDFFFPNDKSSWDQQVIVYICTEWQAEPKETEEMRPEWFNLTAIPYDQMWKDDIYWLPKVLEGHFVQAKFGFDDNDNVISHQIETLLSPT